MLAKSDVKMSVTMAIGMSDLITVTDVSTLTTTIIAKPIPDGHRAPPPPPDPSSDLRMLVMSPPSSEDEARSPRLAAAEKSDIFKVSPMAALRLLSAGVERLVAVTGDIPPTPPLASPTLPNMRGMEAEKATIVRTHSEKSLARLRKFRIKSACTEHGSAPCTYTSPAIAPSVPEAVDGVRLRTQNPTPQRTPSPEFPAKASGPYIIIGENFQPVNTQHSAITRKFYSKLPPPISITEYLLRMHTFCPMSTAVYLATSLYIHRLAVIERAIAITTRNAHRLILAGLRVAMKALEDLSYPHSKIAKVGGVSELELARLEVSFCFLAGFELVVGERALQEQWEMLRDGRTGWEQAEAPFESLDLERTPKHES